MKHRRLLALVMALVMMLGMAPQALAYLAPDGTTEHDHQWGGTEPGRDPTCTEPGFHFNVCTLCFMRSDPIEDPPLGHDWDNGVKETTREPTCTEAGEQVQYCFRCRERRTVTLPALGHDFSSWTVTREPTCARRGERQSRCARCGETVTEAIPTVDHTWGNWYAVKQPTEWEAGLEERKCQVCGTTQQRNTYLPDTVKPGDNSEEAKRLQELLNAAGFDCGNPDGIVGNNTQSAIKEAEQAAGHAATGIGWVGLQQWLEQGGRKPGSSATGTDSSAPSLFLTVTQTSPVKTAYAVDDNISLTIRLTNNGGQPLEMPTYFMEWAYDGTIWNNLQNMVLAPGESVTFMDIVEVWDEDASMGYMGLTFSGQAWLQGADDMTTGMLDSPNAVHSNVVAMTWPTEGGPAPAAPVDDFTMWIDAPESSSAKAGETIDAIVHAKNTGNTNLRLTGIYYGDASDGSGKTTLVSGDAVDGELMNDGALAPGQEKTLTYHVYVTEAEASACLVIRELGLAMHRLENGSLVDNTNLDRSADFSIDLESAPADPQLTLIGQTQEYADFYPGDTFSTFLRADNTGGETLYGLTIERWKWDGSLNDWAYQGAIRQDQADTPTAPGSYIEQTEVYPIIDEDAKAGMVTLLYIASATTASGEMIRSNDYAVEFEVKERGPVLGLYIEPVGDPSQPDGALGEYIKLFYRVTNTSSVAISDSKHQSCDVNDNHVTADGIFLMDGSVSRMEPGGAALMEYYIHVRPEDVAAGVIRRRLVSIGNPYAAGENGEAIDYDTAIPSNVLEFEFPLRQSDLGLFLETLDYSNLVGHLGETLKVPVRLTNTGSETMDMQYVSSRNENDMFMVGDCMYSEPGSRWFTPGEQNHSRLEILVQQEDIDRGYVFRKAKRGGYHIIGGSMSAPIYEEDEKGYYKCYESNWVEILIPLGESDLNASLYLEQAGPASQADGALGEEIVVPLRVTNTGGVRLFADSAASRDGDGNNMHQLIDCDSHTVTSGNSALSHGESFTEDFSIYVAPSDVAAGVIRRTIWQIGYPRTDDDKGLSLWEGEHFDTDTEVISNALTFEFPLRQVPPEGDGTLVLAAGAPTQPDGALGEWIDVPLTVTNTGAATACANNNVMRSPDTGLSLNGPYVETLLTGSGQCWDLEPGQYFDAVLHVYVSQADVDAGVIAREVYYYGRMNSNEAVQYTNTVRVEIPLRPEADDGTYIDLDLSVDGALTAVYAKEGEWIEAPLRLSNNGTAAARMSGWSSWYEGGAPAYYADDLLPEWAGWYWLAPGGSDKQTYRIEVTAEDVGKGVVRRYVQEDGHRWLVTGGVADPSAESPENAAVLDFSFVNTNTLLIEIPLLAAPPETTAGGGMPQLVLSMVQTSPVLPSYKSGAKIEYKWRLTNIGDADCDFGGLKMYFTNQDGSVISPEEAFFGLDGKEVLAAHGGSKSDVGSFTLDAAQIIEGGTVYAGFYGRGFYPDTATVWVNSNPVVFNYLIDDTVPPPEYTPVQVDIQKWEASVSAMPQGYVLYEPVWYGVSVTNNNAFDLYNVVIEDPMFDDGHGGHILGEMADFPAGDTFTTCYAYFVTQQDVNSQFIQNVAWVTWDDPNTNARVAMPSCPVVVPTWNDTPIPPTGDALMILKSEKSAPKNGKFYVEGEMIGYDILVYNSSDRTLHDIRVDDPLQPGVNKTIGYLAELPPHGAKTFSFGCAVTHLDCETGFVTNSATGAYTDDDGQKKTAASNPVTSPAGFEDVTGTETHPGLNVTKIETSAPANGACYAEGETIAYKIILVNTGDTLLTDLQVFDPLAEPGHEEIGSAEMLHPTQARSFYFAHTVTAADVLQGCVLNYAVASYKDGATPGVSVSNPVISDTDGKPDNIIELTGGGFPPIELAGEGEGYVPCTRTLLGKGDGAVDYALHTCTVHQFCAWQAEVAVNAAETPEARVNAWKQVRALWQDEIDKMYEALYEAAKDVPTRLTLLNERMLFNAQVSVYEESLAAQFPGNEELAARKIAEMLEARCADMCYEIHTAPGARVDSCLHGHAALAPVPRDDTCARSVLEKTDTDMRYIEILCGRHTAPDAAVQGLLRGAMLLTGDDRTEALLRTWDTARRLWTVELDAISNDRYRDAKRGDKSVFAAERTTFGNWLKAREELVALFYPDDEATLGEMMAKTIMSRVIDDCIALHEAK